MRRDQTEKEGDRVSCGERIATREKVTSRRGTSSIFSLDCHRRMAKEIPLLSDDDGSCAEGDPMDDLASIGESMVRESISSSEWIVSERPINGNSRSLPIGEKVSLLGQAIRRTIDGVATFDGPNSNDGATLGGANLNDTDQAVEILTKLLASEERKVSKVSDNRRPLEDYSDADLDREVKELKIKRLRSEIQDLEERKNERKAKQRERVLNMREKEERIKYYQSMNQGLHRLMKAADIIISNQAPKCFQSSPAPSMGRETANASKERNLLEEAFHETVSGDK